MQHSEDTFRNQILWFDSLQGSMVSRPSLTGDISVDVAIVGAGFTGLWSAYYLIKRDPTLRISIIEAESTGYGASGRNGGWCSSSFSGIEKYLNDPESRSKGIELQKLMFGVVDEVAEVCQREKIDCHFAKGGTVSVASNEGQLHGIVKLIELRT